MFRRYIKSIAKTVCNLHGVVVFFIVMVVRAVVEVGKFLDVGCARDESGRKTFRLMLDARWRRMENLY